MDATHKREFIFVKSAGFWIVTDITENMSGEQNNYTQIWNFPAFEQGTSVLTGFKNEEVMIDQQTKTIKTADAQGPNLFINSFSSKSLTYEKYYGYWEPGKTGLGWSNRGLSVSTGRYAPRVDVHVKWSDATKNEETRIATVLAPAANQMSPIEYSLDSSQEGITAFEVQTKSGQHIKYYTSSTAQDYQVGGLTITAKTLLVEEKGDKTIGIALYCNEVDGSGGVYENFEFEISNQNLTATEIKVPQGFSWSDGIDHIPLVN